jgi:hypothetical protein
MAKKVKLNHLATIRRGTGRQLGRNDAEAACG